MGLGWRKDKCADSPTLREDWIKEVLGNDVCENVIYDEGIVRDRVERILVFNEYMDICCKNEDKTKAEF